MAQGRLPGTVRADRGCIPARDSDRSEGRTRALRITRIAVQNHVAIPDLDIEVRTHLVLVGPNESGKTSLLRLLDATTSGSLGSLYGRLDKKSLRDPAGPLTVTIQFGDFTTEDEKTFADWIVVPPNPNDPQRLDLVLKVTPTSTSDEVTIERGLEKVGLPLRTSWDDLHEIGWAYLPANRSPDRELGQGRTSAIHQLLSAVDLGDSLPAITAAIDELHATIADAEALSTLRVDLAAALSDLLPRAVAEGDIVLKLPSSDETNPLSDVDVHVREETSARSLRHQSDGVRAMSTVAIQLLTKKAARIVAIDEPEIHLHPRAQGRLGRLLATATGQRVVATHAPAVLARFSPMTVVAFSANGPCRQLANEPFLDDPKVAEHWWTAATLEPLTSRAVILVEGVADRVIVEATARAMGVDLDRLGITVTEVNGAGSFKHAIRLFGSEGFGVPILGLVDLNEADIPADALGIDPLNLNAKFFWVCSADLEEECVRALGAEPHARLLVASGHYREAQILSAVSVPSLSDLTDSAYAAWCRKSKHKVRVAVAFAESMTGAHAQALGPIREVILAAVSAAA